MLETYNLMEDAMLADKNLLDDDVMMEFIKNGVGKFFKRSKFTENILIPSLDAPLGVVEVNADSYLHEIEGEHFGVCAEILEFGVFVSDKVRIKIMNWLEANTVRKSFMINEYKCHILKADLHNDVFICFTVELIEGSAA